MAVDNRADTCPGIHAGFSFGYAQTVFIAGMIAPNKIPFGGIRAAFANVVESRHFSFQMPNY